MDDFRNEYISFSHNDFRALRTPIGSSFLPYKKCHIAFQSYTNEPQCFVYRSMKYQSVEY